MSAPVKMLWHRLWFALHPNGAPYLNRFYVGDDLKHTNLVVFGRVWLRW